MLPLAWPVLVVLDERTWTSGADTAKFVKHIHMAMRIGVHITCVHELPAVVGPSRHACDFALMFNDDWTPAHLTGGPSNLYKEMNLALKGEEWRQPGLVALARTLATSAGEHMPIELFVPKSYEPKTGANPWAETGRGLRTESLAVPESTNSTLSAASLARISLGAAAAMMAPPPLPAEISLPQPQVLPKSVGAGASSSPRPNEIELASLPVAVRDAPPASGLATVPQPAVATNNSLDAFFSHRLMGSFFHPEEPERLDA
jgi:hypothetical protein